MNKTLSIITLFCCITCTIQTYSQQASGLILGKYTSITSTYVNPSALHNSTHNFELQIIGVHGFFDTDYGYVKNSSLLNVLRNFQNIDYVSSDNIINAQNGEVIFKTNNAKSHLFVKSEILGPGLLLKINPTLNVGLSYRMRAHGSISSIPDIFNFYKINNTFTQTIYNADATSGVAMAWSEINAHISYELEPELHIGANVKYIQAHAGTYTDVPEAFSFSSADIESVTAESAGPLTIASTADSIMTNNGSGFGMDFGVTLSNILESLSTLSVSIIDVGAARLNGQKLIVNYDNSTTLLRSDYSNIESVDTLFDQIREDFNVLNTSNRFTILLPTALSVQYRHPIVENYSIEGSLTQRLKLSSNQISRPNSIMVAGVYDTKHISAYLPLTLIDYTRPKVGLAFRVFYLTVGFDDLLSLFGQSQNFDSTDFYVNLRFYPFHHSKNGKKNKNVKCYTF